MAMDPQPDDCPPDLEPVQTKVRVWSQNFPFIVMISDNGVIEPYD